MPIAAAEGGATRGENRKGLVFIVHYVATRDVEVSGESLRLQRLHTYVHMIQVGVSYAACEDQRMEWIEHTQKNCVRSYEVRSMYS